jgi:hypothetical protein
MKKKSKKTPAIKKLPNFWILCGRTYKELTTFWRPLAGVTAIYGLLYFVLVLGFSISYSYNDIVDIVDQIGASGGWLGKNALTIANLFAYSNQASAAAIVQAILFIVAMLAYVWVLRRLRTLQKIRIRDAYYDGPARIVPFTIVIILLLVTFIPAIFGSSILNIALATGSGGFELLVVSIVGGLLLLGSAYWFAAWLPAAYIVSLPKSTPIQAIRSSVNITQKKRLWIMKNCVGLAFWCLFSGFLVMLLFVTLITSAAVMAAYIVSFVIFAVTQTFLFVLYRSLIDEE